MKGRITLPGELTLLAGVLLISFAISLMVKADFGISTISSLPYVLSVALPEISFGIWNPIFHIGLFIILIAITRRVKVGYAISLLMSLTFGLVLDAFEWLLSPLPTDMPFRLAYIVTGYVAMCFAISLMVNSKVPLMVVDAFINDLTQHYHVTFRRLKTIFDISCLTLSMALSFLFVGELVGIGIATIVMAFITGSGVHLATRLLRRAIAVRPWSDRLANMAR
ncbi:hypothetical protein AOA80_08890 [Methanomassiliicoccales archaeon RumEn M1]|jgi:uncharacterized membrane protein YczE|nr:hypothetical protein AOA80_08890 [Methanomassiliicoccales archaeon RumEn M1]